MAAAIVAGTLLLGGCGGDPYDYRLAAIYECTSRSFEIQGIEPIPYDDEQLAEDTMNRFEAAMEAKFNDVATFRLEPDGQLVIDYGRMELPPPYQSYNLKCTGDFNRGVLTSIRVNGRSYEPKPGETWFFGPASDRLRDNGLGEPENAAQQ